MNKGWPLVKLGEVITQYKEYIEQPEAREYPKLSVKLYGKGVVLDSPVDGSMLKMKRHQLARAGQIILSEIWGKKGAIGFVPPEGEGALCTSHFFLFDIHNSNLNKGWLSVIFKANYLAEQLNSKAFGTTGYAAVRPKDLLQIEIPLPPLAEQQRIVAKIERLAGKIEEARSLQIININNYGYLFDIIRSSILSNALKDGDKKLIDVVVLERGKFSHRPRNDPRFFGGDHPWIQISEIETSDKYIRYWYQTLNDEGLSISRKFQKGTLLISIAATIGAVGILEFDCCVPDSIIGVIPKEEIDTEFLFYYFSYLRNHLEEIAPQSAQKNINLQILSQLPFSDISIKDQRAIAAYLNFIKSKIDSLKAVQSQTTADLDALLSSILDKAFKGEL